MRASLSAERPTDAVALFRVLGLETLFLVGAFAVGIVIAGIAAAGMESLRGVPLEEDPMAALLLSPLIIAVAAFIYRLAAKSADPAETGAGPRPDKLAVLPTLALTLGLGIALIVGSTALSWLFERIGWVVVEQGRVVEMTTAVDGGINPAVFVLAPVAGLAAPLAEEWLFRGWYFRRLARRGPLWMAYAASALMFAAIHGNVHGIPIYLLQACVFAFAYARSGRLWAAVGVHFINNAVTLALLVFVQAPVV